MAEVPEFELLKVVYALAGRRAAKIIFWLAMIIIGILVLRPVIESIDWFVMRFHGIPIDWPLLGSDALGAIVLTLLFLGFFGSIGVGAGLLLRIGLWVPIRPKQRKGRPLPLGSGTFRSRRGL